MSSSRLLAALACLLLASCGFHLQGAVKMPTGIRTIYIATSDELTPFAAELRDGHGHVRLRAAGVDFKLAGLREALVMRRTQPKHDFAEGDNP